jgi:23S rRNA pseudouridine1911/1915/1917 synthase
MVIIRTITKTFSKRSEGGKPGSIGVSDMVGPYEDEDAVDGAKMADGDVAGNRLIIVIGADAAPRLDKALAAAVPEQAALSRSRLMKMIDEGDVLRGGVAVTNPKTKVKAGEEYTLILAPAVDVATLPEDIPLSVIWEDGDLIVIDKPAGMVVHPAPGTPSGTLVNALLHHCGDTLSGIGGERRPGIVHRIDKDTTGLLVVAKSDRAHHGLAAQFEAHTVNRRYIAVVNGVPSAYDPRIRGLRGITFEAGGILKIATHLERHKTDRQRQAVVWNSGRHAVTRTRAMEDFKGGAALMECWLETGRTHQIRVHMAYAGHGLVGDQTYGGKKKVSPKLFGAEVAEMGNSFPRQALHAATLGFAHPVTGEMLEFTSPLPADLEGLLAALRKGQD